MNTNARRLIRRLVDCCELESSLGEEALVLRIELFEFAQAPGTYSARIWRLESYRLQSTFPQTNAVPSHEPSDELILKEFEGFESPLENGRPFPSSLAAMNYVVEQLDAWLETLS